MLSETCCFIVLFCLLEALAHLRSNVPFTKSEALAMCGIWLMLRGDDFFVSER